MMGRVNAKHERFVAEYLIDLNATQAAIRAGYSEKTANREGSRLLSNADIAKAIAERKERQLATADLTAARVLEELRRLAFADPRRLFDENGRLKPITDWSAEDAACLASFEITSQKVKGSEDDEWETVKKIRVWDKTKALDLVAKHFGLLKEKIELSTSAIGAMSDAELDAQIVAAAARVKR